MQTLIPVRATTSHDPNNFDAIRLAMALAVVWSHSFALHLGSNGSEWVSLLLSGRYDSGNLGVMVFFIISGFLITQSWERSKSTGSYFRKRIRRIHPGYFVSTSICAFVIAPLFGGVFPSVPKTIAMNLLLQGYIPPAFPLNPLPRSVNGSLWSIPFEFWCYIGVAAGGALLLKRPYVLIWLTALLMLGHLGFNVTGWKPDFPRFTMIFGLPLFWTMIGPSFLLGMATYSYGSRIPRRRAILAGLFVLSVVTCRFRGIHEFVVAPALAYAVFYVAFSPRIRLHRASAFGDFSYGTYLYAFPIQQMLQAIAGQSLNTAEFIAVSTILSLLAGVLSWHLVEKRFLARSADARLLVHRLNARDTLRQSLNYAVRRADSKSG